jgi:N-acetyl sugar amidotransferase
MSSSDLHSYNPEQLKRDPAVNGGRSYRQCAITVMDTIADPSISFDDKGISNYYHDYKKLEQEAMIGSAENEKLLESMINAIKEEGKGKKYDCVTGVSGGVDSSYTVLMAKRWGLRPLIVHFDNGWNSEIAVKNINNIIQKTGFDLFTIVVNWEEFRDLQLAYIKSGVVDWEVPTDHAIAATWYKLAKKYDVKTVLSGNNIVTEAVMPPKWNYNKSDYVNLQNIHKQFGSTPLKTFPIYGFWQQHYMKYVKGVKYLKPLNLTKFNKQEAKDEIKKEFGWVDYGGKHYESVYTKFYQAYVLPVKFHIDKRKPHLSNLILSGQMTKEAAVRELEQPLYNETELAQEKEYVLKKLGLSKEEFDRILKSPPVPHEQYGVQPFITQQFPLLKLLKPFKRLFK